jgi:hypothetical protein
MFQAGRNNPVWCEDEVGWLHAPPWFACFVWVGTMSHKNDDDLKYLLPFVVTVWAVGSLISAAFKMSLFWGIVLAISLVLGGCYLYAFYHRRAIQGTRSDWTSRPLARLAQETNQQEEERRKEAERQQNEREEIAARAKWQAYHESKSMAEIAGMSGQEFEKFLARLFARTGYTDITLTPTNDQGGDLLCTSPSGERVVIQAKRWRGSVGNSAVQQLLGAMVHYGRTRGSVVTNSTFTGPARELAAKDSRITLLDGRWLAEQIKQFLPPVIPEFNWEEYNRVVKGWQPARTSGKRSFKPRRSKRGQHNKTWTVRKGKREANPQTPENAPTVSSENQRAAEQQRAEQQQREKRKAEFIKRRQQEERQKAEAAVAERKRKELEGRKRAERSEQVPTREEGYKQDEGQPRLATEVVPQRIEPKAREEQAQQVPVAALQQPSTKRSRAKETSEADDIASVTAGVVRMCRGQSALPVEEVRRMITRKFVAVRRRSPTLQVIETIEAAVVDRLAANRSDGWIYFPVKRSGTTAKPVPRSATENASPGQENAIRAMEGD